MLSSMSDTIDPGRAVDPLGVCSLSADALSLRLRWVREEIQPHVVRAERLGRGIALDLHASPGLEARIDAWIELERACCAGIDFARVSGGGPDVVRIEIRGVDPEAPVFRDWFGSGGPA